MREDLRQAGRFTRLVRPGDPEPPLPPALPPGALVTVPGRGELFLRRTTEPAGTVPVLLLHGWAFTADTNWFALYDALDGERPLVAPDHRNHGRGLRPEAPFTLEACADDAAGLLRTLGIRRVIVAGYSMGGPVALLLAQRHAELVEGLVLGATALEWKASWWDRLGWRVRRVREGAARVVGGRRRAHRAAHDVTEDNPDLAPIRAWLEGEARRTSPADMAQTERALTRFDGRPFAALLEVPTAVVVTTADRLVRPRKQRRLAETMHAQVFTVDAGHDLPLVKPKQFAVVMGDAIDWVAARAGRPSATATATATATARRP